MVITTAAVPGRPAPRLVSAAMVERMRPGSVIVDLAAASGGNCELTVDGEEIEHGGVLVIGAGDLPSEVATTASTLYARNVTNLLALLVHDGEVRPDFDDDIVAATCVTAGGAVRHAPTRDLLAGDGRRDRQPSRHPGHLRAGRLRRLRGHLQGARASCTPR